MYAFFISLIISLYATCASMRVVDERFTVSLIHLLASASNRMDWTNETKERNSMKSTDIPIIGGSTCLGGYDRIANRHAKHYVASMEPFIGSNLYAVRHNDGMCFSDKGLYVIYSYGRHYPLAVYDPAVRIWFGNSDNYSPSTERHKLNCGYPGGTNTRTTERLIALIAAGGVVNLVAERLAA